jgi:hypothetical protein
LEAPFAVLVGLAKNLLPSRRAEGSAQRLEAADSADLRHDTSHPSVMRRDFQYMSASIAGAPNADPLSVYLWLQAQEGDRIAVSAPLQHRIRLLPRFTTGLTEIDVVEGEDDETTPSEEIGIFRD